MSRYSTNQWAMSAHPGDLIESCTQERRSQLAFPRSAPHHRVVSAARWMAWNVPRGSTALRLLPWVSTLAEMELCPEIDRNYVESLEDPAPVWIVWLLSIPEQQSPTRLRRMFEVMELLVLMAKTDSQAWRDAVEMLATFDYDIGRTHLWTDVKETIPHRRVSGYDVVCTSQADFVYMREFLLQEQEPGDALATEFEHVRATFETTLATPVVVPVRLRLHLEREEAFRYSHILASIADLAAFQSSMSDDCELARLRSRFVEKVVDGNGFLRADELFLRQAVAMHAHGLRLSSLPILEVAPSRNNAVFLMQALQTLLVPGSDCLVRNVERVNMNHVAHSVPLWSAVAESTLNSEVFTIRRVNPVVSDHDRKCSIQWFAYAAFHTHGRAPSNKVARIRCGPFTSQDVHWMQEILTHQDPLQILFQHDQESIQQHERHRINTSKVSLYDPMEMAEGDAAVSDGLNLKRLRVLKREGEWWVVLVPGWGRGWVHTSEAVVSLSALDAETEAFESCWKSARSTELDLTVTAEDNDGCEAVLALLELVGASVCSLRIYDKHGLANGWIPAISPACPNLRTLNIEFGVIVRLESLAEHFARGLCPKLRSFTFHFHRMANDTLADVAAMLRVLADNSHPMAKQLDEFSVQGGSMENHRVAVDAGLHELALRVLQNNTHLTFLKIDFTLATTTPERVPEMRHQFAIHNNVLLPEACTRLGPREKAAFLSVAWGQGDPADADVGCALRLPDATVVSSIFQFITCLRFRRIEIRMPIDVAYLGGD